MKRVSAGASKPSRNPAAGANHHRTVRLLKAQNSFAVEPLMQSDEIMKIKALGKLSTVKTLKIKQSSSGHHRAIAHKPNATVVFSSGQH